jgi:hypothetical protein
LRSDLSGAAYSVVVRKVATLAEVPVDELLVWRLNDAERHRLAELGRRLDALRSASDPNGGTFDDSQGPHATSQKPFGTALGWYDNHSDWLELAVDVWPDSETGPVVTATVEVACFCPNDHNVHEVVHLDRAVAGPVDLIYAMRWAVDHLTVWAADSRDPSEWRRRFNLPDR